MTNQQAAAKAKKRWGNRFYVRNSGHMSSPERRSEALRVVQEARARQKEIDDEVRRRMKEMDWYQELCKERRQCVETISKTEGNAHHYRFSIGKSGGMFTEIIGSGDTWEEAFAQADQREGKANAA